jgi:hypothetical protein
MMNQSDHLVPRHIDHCLPSSATRDTLRVSISSRKLIEVMIDTISNLDNEQSQQLRVSALHSSCLPSASLTGFVDQVNYRQPRHNFPGAGIVYKRIDIRPRRV